MMKKKMEMDQNEAEIKFHRVKKHAWNVADAGVRLIL